MGKQEGKKLTKIKNKHQRETASPYGLPKPLRRRGCAWRDTECCELGRWKEEELNLKGVCLFLMVKCL